MTTDATRRNPSMKRPRTAVVLSTLALIAATLMPGGAAGAQLGNAAPLHQEDPTSRLPYDGVLDLRHLETAAAPSEVEAPELGPEYTNWSKLVFQSYRNMHDWEVFGASGDGSNQANLSNNGSTDLYPRLNRGATRVAFSSRRDGNYEIYVMNVNGSGQTRLTNNGADDVYPAWSPDGNKIAFQSYRDGQPEIYVMNANGSGQTRLTNNGDYDGQPAWSPDNTKIAFVRKLSGQYRVWVMNADGSNPQQRSGQALSQGPVWSPDGTKIAYDSDGDGDGWQEIWLMDAGGGNQRQVYKPAESNTDAWVRSWSPDGRYVAFSRITWTYYQGQWYWTTAYLDAWDSTTPWTTIRLSNTGYDWHPGWETTDAQAPTSRVQALPAQSPGPFMVRWTGADTGGSGFKNYDIQVKDGPNGTWNNWKTNTSETSASYPGVGSHTYYFRSRARDNAGNLEVWPASHDAATTVEALPPQTAVSPLPPYGRNGLLVQWGGSDPGGSGIDHYDVQYRQGNNSWTDWRMGVAETAANFSGTAGVEYRFRARARDTAQNLEAWPASADATTMLYNWAITGQVTDNRGAPVTGMGTTTVPGAFHTQPSDGDGAYTAHVSNEATSYSASWSKAGYGALPSTAFAPNRDAAVDVVLPPLENAVQNGGFESGNGAWQFGGNLTATVTASDRHSGTSSALLGQETSPLRSVVALAEGPGQVDYVDTVIDIADTIHSVWRAQEGVMYCRKPLGGSWLTPTPIPGSSDQGWLQWPQVVVDDMGTVHVVWISNKVYYSQNRLGAGWSAPESIAGSDLPIAYKPGITQGQNGTIKVTWGMRDGDNHNIYYAERNSNGHWTTPKNISALQGWDSLITMATDSSGRAHVLWQNLDGHGRWNVFYSTESGSGAWLPPRNLAPSLVNYQDANMAVDSDDAVHVTWAGTTNTSSGLYYDYRSPAEVWSSPERIAPTNDYITGLSLLVDNLTSVHLVWGDGTVSQVKYARRSNGTWSTPVGVAPSTNAYPLLPTLEIDEDQSLHLLWQEYLAAGVGPGVCTIRYAVRDPFEQWSSPSNVHQMSCSSSDKFPQLVVQHSGIPHATWETRVEHSEYAIYYAGTKPQPTAGEAHMSQVVQIPTAELAPTLSFVHRFGHEFPSNNSLEVQVDDGISPTVAFSTTAATDEWRHSWADLTPWAGRSVTLTFRISEPVGSAVAWAYVDEVTLGSAHPDIWVSLSGQPAVLAGGMFNTAIAYGNRGGVAASNGQVTLQFPAELSYVSANPPPSATAPLRWDVGDLLPGQSSNEILVTLQMAGTAPFGTTPTTNAGITSYTVELEQANNTATGAVFVGSLRYMPLIVRH